MQKSRDPKIVIPISTANRDSASKPGKLQNTRAETYTDQRQKIESIRANNPIEQVVGRYVELRPSGRRLIGRCPMHEDRSPSLVVYPHNQSWFCFGCDAGGDVFTFIRRMENLSFGEALQRLGAGESIETHSPSSTAMPYRASTLSQASGVSDQLQLSDEHFTLLTAAVEVYHAAIFSQPAMLNYLAKRKIDLDMIRRHRIGYATGNDLAKYFRFRGWNPDVAHDLGLMGPHGEYFRQRIVIPELRAGKAIYIVGRATQKYQRAKYLGLPGAPKPLYGSELVRQANEIFIVEGAMDWLTLVGWGYPTVALLGSHLKHEQIGEIADAERIFITTDSDEPGRKSAKQLAAMLGKRARIVPPLPNVKDVNELAMKQNGQAVFARLVEQARSSSR